MYHYYPMMQGFDGAGMIMSLFWLAIFVVVVIVAVRMLKRDEHFTNNRTDPLDIVKERYAKGEITKEQFEALKKDLK